MEKQDINRTANRLASLSTRLTTLVGEITTTPTEGQIDEVLSTIEKISTLCGKLEQIEGIRRARLREDSELTKLRE